MFIEWVELVMVWIVVLRLEVVKFGCFVLVIFFVWVWVILLILLVCGLVELDLIFVVFLIRIVVGGVFIINVKDLFVKVVIIIGIGSFGLMFCVWVLKVL